MNPYYQTDNITIYHANCLDVLPIPSRLVFTSPPYNMKTRIRNGQYTSKEHSGNFSVKYSDFPDALSPEEYYQFHSQAITKMLQSAPTVLWNVQLVTGNKLAVLRIFGDMAHLIKDIIVWDKGWGQPAMRANVLNRATEFIVAFERDATDGRTFSHSTFPRGEMQDIWRIKRGTHATGHQATFPIGLPLCGIQGWSNEGDTILDPFMGTGTTLLAANQLNRKAVGIEISERYCEIAAQRLTEQLSQPKLL